MCPCLATRERTTEDEKSLQQISSEFENLRRNLIGRFSKESNMATWSALLILCACAILVALPRARASTSVVNKSKWTLCSSKNYAVNIKDVLISPDPIVAGAVATFTIPAFANEELNGGSVVVTVLFHGIRVHTERDDLCAKAACPVKGEFTLDNAEAMPSFTPPGPYKLKFQVLDSSGKEMACASVSFSIVWKAELEQLIDAASAVQKKMGKRAFTFALAEHDAITTI